MVMQRERRAVLVVDDDEMSREVLCVLLAGEGYDVIAAATGDAALAKIDGTVAAPAIILTDLQMPGLTGVRLAEALRVACGPATLLLAMSASKPAPKDEVAFDGFLLKPFSTQDFASLVSKVGSLDARGDVRDEDVAATNLPTPTVLDEATYRQLGVAIPAKQMLELYGIFVKDSRERIEQMGRLFEERDAVTFIREAHSIKGGAAMLGAREICLLATALEKDGLAAEGLGAPPGASDVYGVHRNVHAVNPLDELEAAFTRLERILVSRDAP